MYVVVEVVRRLEIDVLETDVFCGGTYLLGFHVWCTPQRSSGEERSFPLYRIRSIDELSAIDKRWGVVSDFVGYSF